MDYIGKFRAVVQDINDPENRGRVTVSCPAVFGSSTSGWCEPCVPVGDFCVPTVGMPVFIEFQQNDLRKAIWSGTWQKVSGSSDKIISYGGATICLTGGKVLINGVDVLSNINSLEDTINSLEKRIASLEKRI